MDIPRRKACVLLAASGLIRIPTCANAQVDRFPSRSIRMIVTFPPGGSADTVVRMIVPLLNERLGQQVVVDNRPGAGGNIGLSLVARAAPDGYTLGVGAAGALAANSSLYSQMPFDPMKDLRAVAMLAAIPFVIVGEPTGARTLSQLIAFAKAHPGQLSMGHGGNGTAMHLSAALFAQMSGVQFVMVPYKGSGPAALDVLGGQIPLAVVDLPASLQQIKAGKLVAYAVTSSKRLPMLPDVPTVAEAGVPGYESTGWFGVVAPADTPQPIVSRVWAQISAALADPGIRTDMRNLGVEPATSTPQSFAAYIGAETLKWASVIKTAGIKLD
jgi:tripartite-type tricarboxylate transporter receptor subunit TctC